MKNKIIIIIVFVTILLIGGYFIMKNINEAKIDDNNQTEQNDNFKENDNISMDKSLVLYFSATGITKQVAQYISDEVNGDITEIIPKNKYTSEDLSYTNDECRANIEQQDDNSRPEIENTINIDEYDTIYLGYPIWWGDAPKIILTLLDNYNFDGKTIIPFCTSGSSGISQSMSILKSYNKNVNWVNGKRFGSSTSRSDITSWINELK